MDITFEQPFAELRGGADSIRRLTRSAVVAVVFGALAVWGAAGALASTDAGGFVHDPVSVSTSTGTMFTLPALAPGESVTRFATVTSAGSPATVRLFATVSGTGLARFLSITVTRGTGGTKAFVPATTGGAGSGIVYSGTLADFPQTWGGGVRLGGTWPAGHGETYRFEISLSNAAAAQGLTAGADFRWEARQA
ncbi:MAG: hypothetical protein ACXVPX_09110 [Actinomycetota bacterium]